jgi:hypothetical protein
LNLSVFVQLTIKIKTDYGLISNYADTNTKHKTTSSFEGPLYVALVFSLYNITNTKLYGVRCIGTATAKTIYPCAFRTSKTIKTKLKNRTFARELPLPYPSLP